MELLGVAAIIAACFGGLALIIWALASFRRAAPLRHPAEREVKGMIDSLTGRMNELGEQRFGRDVLAGLREQAGGEVLVRRPCDVLSPEQRQKRVLDGGKTLPRILDTSVPLPRVPVKGPHRRTPDIRRGGKDRRYYVRREDPELTGRRQPGYNPPEDTVEEEEKDDTGTGKQG